jgi:hypothetical protein
MRELHDSTAMSEYVLKIDDQPQAEALITYLRSLDFVELLPKEAILDKKQDAISGMKSFLGQLPDNNDFTQEAVNEAMKQLRRTEPK